MTGDIGPGGHAGMIFSADDLDDRRLKRAGARGLQDGGGGHDGDAASQFLAIQLV